MNKRWIVVGMTCLSLLLGQLGQASAAVAPTMGSAQLNTYEETFSSADTSLSGIMSSRQFNFQTEEYWKVDEVKIHVDYKASPLTKRERSSVTLALNGKKFHSFRPEVSDDPKRRLTVSVPKELLVKGNNTLTIEGYIVTTDANQICMPSEKRDNWLQLFATSGASIRYTSEAIKPSIRDFSRHFTGMDTISTGLSAIAIPRNSSSAELESAVYALSGFAKQNRLKQKQIPMYAFDTDALKGKKAVVAMALYNQLPAAWKSELGKVDVAQAAVIRVIRTGTQPTLVVTSQDPAMLVKAGRLLANQELVKQLDGDTKIVSGDTDVATPEVSISRDMKLTDNGDKLKGWMHQEKSYFISLPANRTIAEASKIHLDMRYATNLDFDRSMVTVLINNTPIGSKKLSMDLANKDTLTLPIPNNLDVTGSFTVTVAFDLELRNVVCMEPQDEMPWAFITKDSVLQLKTKDKTELLFDSYPNPFLRDGSFNQVAVVMPKNPDMYTYQSLGNVFNLLGQYAEGNAGEVRFFADQASASDLKAHNVIAIGSYNNNKIIRDNNDKLYFKYGANGEGFVSNEKMSVDADYGKRLGTLQLIESPYEEGRGLLAISGPSTEYDYLASKLLASDNAKWRIYGDGVATNKDGDIHAFRFKKQAEQQATSIMDQVLQRGDVLGFMVATMLIGLLVIVSLIFIIRKYRKKRGADDETKSK
ncbi:cellulose biosynthesis cyclic di-GMP-binding regulatory protein BcsB [Paenibacillus alvei]|uniref:cellulose biosynthesis cyclic di-GMP-binding regulatory protein BcsB n=1 Tax=Paenibacillus alvei TaxID=44250 RepID=UPI00227F8417|nr:cellulose biosynthesis cyclic di-GMP-binding regulatory protein BcsB [Paenibacillus alvei]MCY7484139.1 cellulose biosynthesis cyclic di-GMP-binding regulatory protein BcsB [Paenibacillus alvei]